LLSLFQESYNPCPSIIPAKYETRFAETDKIKAWIRVILKTFAKRTFSTVTTIHTFTKINNMGNSTANVTKKEKTKKF